jgi:hypothetical protein
MVTLRTKVHVTEDGRIEATAPGALPPGDHEAVITVEIAPRAEPQFRWEDFPVHEGDWDHSISLRREDIYGPDGR